MAELFTLARPYAKAAFEFALADSQLSSWSESLATAAQVAEQPEVKALLSSPTFTAEQITDQFAGLFEPALSGAEKNFVATLAENKRLALLPQISVAFEALKAEQEQSQDVEITSAFELNDERLQALSNSLQKKLAKAVNVRVVVDPDLLGGVIIRAGDMVIDNSLRGKLAKLGDVLN